MARYPLNVLNQYVVSCDYYLLLLRLFSMFDKLLCLRLLNSGGDWSLGRLDVVYRAWAGGLLQQFAGVIAHL